MNHDDQSSKDFESILTGLYYPSLGVLNSGIGQEILPFTRQKVFLHLLWQPYFGNIYIL